MKGLSHKVYVVAFFFLLSVFQGVTTSKVYAAAEEGASDHAIMNTFNADEVARAKQGIVEDEVKHKILFWMGITLLILIIITAAVGINMAFFGKEIFVAHMIFAGATVFLSFAHAVTAIVWFFPF